MAAISVCLAGATAIGQPAVTFSTHFGGGGRGYNEEQIMAVAVDSQGRPVAVGNTASPDFPLTQTFLGTPATFGRGGFVARWSRDGSRLEYATFLPGCHLQAIALDSQGNPVVVGRTQGESFPGGDSIPALVTRGETDALVVKLAEDGSRILFQTRLGGTGVDLAHAVAIDRQDAVYVAGMTLSTNFPVTAGVAQAGPGGGFDAFVTRLNPDGKGVSYSTYLGGSRAESGLAMVVDSNREVYLTGVTGSASFPATAAAGAQRKVGVAGTNDRDCYVARLSADGSTLRDLVLLGGSENDVGVGITLDAAGNVCVLGQTVSTNFPVVNAVQATKAGPSAKETFDERAFDAVDYFVTVLAASGLTPRFSTYFGGDASESGMLLEPYINEELPNIFTETGSIHAAPDGSIWISGWTASASMAPAVERSHPVGNGDLFLAQIFPDRPAFGSVSYLGGTAGEQANALALGSGGDIWVAGSTEFAFRAPYFPVLANSPAPQMQGSVSDAFLVRWNLLAAGAGPSNDQFARRQLIPGTHVTLFGSLTGAKSEPGEPVHGGVGIGSSIWWSWKAPASGSLTLLTSGSGPDTVLAVYQGTTLSSLQAIGRGVTDPSGNGRRLVMPVLAGQEYQIAVDGMDEAGVARGDVILSLTFSQPKNDDFSGRSRLTGLPAAATGSNVNATFERLGGDDVAVDPTIGGRTVWWEWTAPAGTNVAVVTHGSTFDTLLSVLTRNPEGRLVTVDENNNFEDLATSQVTFAAASGVTYYLCVDGERGESGLVELAILPATAPVNDRFATRTQLTGSVAAVTGENTFATREDTDPTVAVTRFSNEASSTLWWEWSAPTNGAVRLNTHGSTFDTRLVVFVRNPDGSLQLVERNDNDANRVDSTSRLEFMASQGQTYQILLEAGPYQRRGRFALNLRLSLPALILADTVALNVDGSVRFDIKGLPGVFYQVERSSDLKVWSLVTSTPIAGSERISFQDAAPAGGNAPSALYYRVVDVP